jgi:hypothetical protein
LYQTPQNCDVNEEDWTDQASKTQRFDRVQVGASVGAVSELTVIAVMEEEEKAADFGLAIANCKLNSKGTGARQTTQLPKRQRTGALSRVRDWRDFFRRSEKTKPTEHVVGCANEKEADIFGAFRRIGGLWG